MSGRTAIAKIGAACAASAFLAAASCGGERTDEGAAKGAGGKPAVAAAEIAKPGATATAPAADSGGRGVDGTATVVAESKPGAESPLRLVLGGGGRLGGTIVVDGAKCEIAGTADDSIARGWVECPSAAEGAPPRRGTLIGEKAGSSYSGTFAVSDDGAAVVFRGTWKAGGL